jgi:hypothetical protein
MADSASGTAPDAISELTQLGREIDELFGQQYDRLCFHNDETENAYRRDEDRISSLIVADGISDEKRKEFAQSLIAHVSRYRDSFVKSLLALDDEIGLRIAAFAERVEKLAGNAPDDSNEALRMVRRWVVLSRELHAVRAEGSKGLELRVESDTVLPKKILRNDGNKDIPFSAEEGAAFQQTMAEVGALLKHSHEENLRVEAERKPLSLSLFGTPPQPAAPDPPSPQPSPVIVSHPLQGKAWFRTLKVLYLVLWMVAAAICGLMSYFGSETATVFWAGVISAAVLIIAKKVFYYITLGRTTAMEKPGSGFVDLGDMESTFATLQSNSPDLYTSVVEPYLNAWKKQYGRRIPQHAFGELQQRINKELSDLGQQKKKLIDDAMKEGKMLDLTSLRARMEKTKAEYMGADREDYVRGIDIWLMKLEAKYGTAIPLDEASQMLDDLEAKIRKDTNASA